MRHVFKNVARSLLSHRGVKAVALGVVLPVVSGCFSPSPWRYPVGHQSPRKGLFQQKQEIRSVLRREYGLMPVPGNSDQYRYPDGSIVNCKDRVGVAGLYSECEGPDGRFTVGGRFGARPRVYAR